MPIFYFLKSEKTRALYNFAITSLFLYKNNLGVWKILEKIVPPWRYSEVPGDTSHASGLIEPYVCSSPELLTGHPTAFYAGSITRRCCYRCGGAAHRNPLYSAGAWRLGAGADCLDGRIGHYSASLAH